MTTACLPPTGQSNIGESCLTDPYTADSAQCRSGACNMLPWSYEVSSQANCSQICSNSSDCGANQICGIMYGGELESPAISSTGEEPGRYLDAFLGCFTPVDFTDFPTSTMLPGRRGIGSTCDATSVYGDLSCRSYMCAGFAPIVGKCTEYCARDSDCQTSSTPNWKCRVAENNHTSMFLQGAQVADESSFSLVGICSP